MLLEELIVKLGVQADTAKLEDFIKKTERIQAISKIKGTRIALGIKTSDKLNQKMGEAITGIAKLKKEMETLSRLDDEKKQNAKLTAYMRQAKQAIEYTKQLKRESDRIANIKPNSLDGRRYGFKSAANTVDMFNEKINRANPIIQEITSKIGALGALAGVGFSFQRYISISDQWKTISAQIKNVTKGSQEAADAQKELYNIASRTRQNYSETAGLFTSVSRSASELGKSTSDILNFTEDVSNAMLLGGGSAASQQAALVQLGQALGSGTLRGDELNSIMEQAPRLAQVIAQGMGTTIGNLRKLGSEGKITAQAVFEAVRSQSDKLKGELGNMPWTVQQAATKAQNAIGMLFYTLESKLNIGSTIASGIAKLAEVLEKINNILVEVPVEDIYNWLKLIAITVGVIYTIVKRNAIIMALQTVITLLGITSFGFTGAAAAAGVFQAASIRAAISAAAAWLVAAAPVALVVAGIVLLILLLEDFYGWMTGKESVFGDWFGSFDDVVKKAKKAWIEFVTSCEQWTKKHFLECLKDVLNLIIEILKRMSPLYWMYRGITYLVGTEVKPLIDTSNDRPWIDSLREIDFQKDIVHGGAAAIATDYSGRIGRFGGINNSGNQTINNYITANGDNSDRFARNVVNGVVDKTKFSDNVFPEEWGR